MLTTRLDGRLKLIATVLVAWRCSFDEPELKFEKNLTLGKPEVLQSELSRIRQVHTTIIHQSDGTIQFQWVHPLNHRRTWLYQLSIYNYTSPGSVRHT